MISWKRNKPKKELRTTQHASKVVSNDLGLVDFAIMLVSFVLKLPNGQVTFFGRIQIIKELLTNLLIKNCFSC